jgi:hypothetical protein
MFDIEPLDEDLAKRAVEALVSLRRGRARALTSVGDELRCIAWRRRRWFMSGWMSA